VSGQLAALSRQLWRASIRWVRWRMTISFSHHQFPPEVIRHAVWLYVRDRRFGRQLNALPIRFLWVTNSQGLWIGLSRDLLITTL
jgi:hypothetical protein